ncbi:MAG: NAD(P)H nitroreductase [Candidatus Omnitrophica bacterium]|nr:NAD(P)H nitroreductase [Candidatus Omnitrophota bacterium]
MKSFLDLAKQRRSVRTYINRKITRSHLEKCVEAARFAPSACNSQEWRFVAVDSPEKKKEIDGTFKGPYAMNSFASGCAAYIVIVLDSLKTTAWAGGKVMGTDFRRIDIGIACDHIVMQAQDLGIGSCILGWFNEKAVKRILNVPRNRKIELLISLGYPDPGKEKLEKYMKDRKEVLGFNTY